MADTDKLMRARTKFKVVNNVSTRFKLTQHSDLSGMRYNLPYNGTFDISLDITTYPGWKGELRAAFIGGGASQSAYAEFFLMPWHGYDLSKLLSSELYIASCKMTYVASYTENGNYYSADIHDQEIIDVWGDLMDLQQEIGNHARPKTGLFLFALGGSTVYQIMQSSTSTELPAFKETLEYGWEKRVIPIGIWDGTRHIDDGVGYQYTMVSSVTFETLE